MISACNCHFVLVILGWRLARLPCSWVLAGVCRHVLGLFNLFKIAKINIFLLAKQKKVTRKGIKGNLSSFIYKKKLSQERQKNLIQDIIS